MGQSGSAQAADLPQTQRRLVLVAPTGLELEKAEFRVEEAKVPVPKSGEVLVRMAAAPVNPSDFGSWMAGAPGAEYPKCVGNEGAGTVVATGGGWAASRLMGKKVGVVAREQGTYQQYVCVDAMTGAFLLDQSLPVEGAASFFVNPYTAVGILDTAQARGARAFVHTAAASQLGQMIVKLAPMQGMTVVNVVRREEQAEMLRALGAQYVVVQTDGWEDRLSAIVKELDVTVAFDCVAGDQTGKIMSLMPAGSTTFVYGGLSEQPVAGLSVLDLIYHSKKVEGWLLPRWLMGGGKIQTVRRISAASSTVNAGLGEGGWAESQFEDCTLEEMFPKLCAMRAQRGSGGFTGRKLRIRMDQ